MTHYPDTMEPTVLSPDDAFDVLGNETRFRMLRTLGDADDWLSFTELRDRVGIQQGGQFNYHLDKLVGHFVEKTDAGYALREPGRRVVQAVRSGALTDAPVLERMVVDQNCYRCGGPLEIKYQQEHVEQYCTECPGTFDIDGMESGYLGCLPLPPAGLQGRSADEAFRAAWTRGKLRGFAIASGICPRCSAPVEQSVEVCEAHDESERVCDRCAQQHAVSFLVDCTNCIFDANGTLSVALLTNTELLSLLTDHGLNPVDSTNPMEVQRAVDSYDETVLSTDPFEVQVTFTVDGDALTLTVDENLEVFSARRDSG